MTSETARSFGIWVRVYYEDTDAAGVVYHARYLAFMERARTEWLRQFGLSAAELARREQVLLAVRSIEIDYRRPARLDDLLYVTTGVVSVRGASMTLHQSCLRGEELLCEARIDLACLDGGHFRPRKLPPELACVSTFTDMPARRNI
ncbi:MAG: tol-pal system-associated acyl-CoA thioesterase [Gammaproteobacteria bacterium]|nr:tol-pal system-associated acyl-CoA thioesterase [Gammaproteobacteria bacterium]